MRALLVGCALAATASAAVPAFPLQFVATVETTAHLVDKSKPYPPWKKRIRLAYDYLNKRARADVLEGLDAGKNFTRRYDTKQDYVTTGGTFPSCQRSYLGERMPLPKIPEGAVKQSSGALIDDEPSISLLVLGADTQSETAGPLISFLMSRGASRCRVPITVVPGNLSDDQLDTLF